ncbi:MAG: ABC transporter substrate-binding protein [Anaerolineae bacterium]|nr:MAG: ABC transporter substrate-binding protein [Anaerolineae bacterium]
MLKRLLFLAWGALALAACAPQRIVETVVVEKTSPPVVQTVVVTPEPVPEKTGPACCETFRIGTLGEPVTLNYWQYLGGAPTVWTYYVLSNVPARLFALSDTRFQLVPSLAKDMVLPAQNADGTWSVTVELLADARWSDGEPITAEDVVFTFDVCKQLGLDGEWPSYCTPAGAEITAEAVDELSVRFTFQQQPTLLVWQAGLAQMPVLPRHYWQDVAEQALAQVAGVDLPSAEDVAGCTAESTSAACTAWAAYEGARSVLYTADASGQPVAGAYAIEEWRPGEYIRLVENEQYPFRGMQIAEYADGTWERKFPDGVVQQLYGNAQGEKTLEYEVGPFNPQVEFLLYPDWDSLGNALLAGDVQYVLDPQSPPDEWLQKFMLADQIRTFVNSDYDLYYLAFNLLKSPAASPEFRQAVDALVDRGFLVNQVLNRRGFPLYTAMPPANAFWYNAAAETPYRDLSRAERLSEAVAVLKRAGWQWDNEPYWDAHLQAVVAGQGLKLPDGRPVPELTLVAPGYTFDPVRATAALWLARWVSDLGIAVRTELLGRDALLERVFINADFDMYIIGWGLGSPDLPLYFSDFWYSGNCTFESGGNNTTCFKNSDFDALVERFSTAADVESAREIVFAMQEILAEQRPVLPLYSQAVYDVARRNVVFPFTTALGGLKYRAGLLPTVRVLQSTP